MEECESLASEVTELQEFQSEASEAISQDDEDEVEELENSLREIVQDQSVKPKLQCLMVDPSFSMVTVQSEDSGIVWETASSRCSTPWASETSSISEAYSMEGSGAAGKITIVFDEEKVVRRRTRSGRSSRLGDRLSRPGSSRSASALGVERPEMAEVSLPNVKQEKTQTEPDLEEIKNKDQQLFSLISEGYEILNIRVPSKLPTVDEEETTDLQDNLSYLDQTPKIRSRNYHDWTTGLQQNDVLPEDGELQDHQEPSKQDSSQLSADTELRHTPTKESTSDIDYFEKFTLVDVVVPGEQAPELQEETEEPAAKPQVEEQNLAKETAADSPSASVDSFVFVTDVDIVGEHLDEVFYGQGAPDDVLQRREDDEAVGGKRTRRESQRSVKENGSVLFGSEDTILTPIFLSPGPPKIIDPILLEEPTAMSFMYSDLYEDVVGERRKSDEEHSEAESVASEKTYKRRFSDSEEADGYLEKFILKDETPTVEVQPESAKDQTEGRMIWSQSKFDTTGCLTRVVKEEEEDKAKREEPKAQEVSVGDGSEDLRSAAVEDKREIVKETEKEREEILLPTVTEEPAVSVESAESTQESKIKEDQLEDQEVKHKVKRDQTEPPESSTDEPLQQVDSKVEKTQESEEHQRDLPAEKTSIIETEQPCLAQKEVEKAAQVVVDAGEDTAEMKGQDILISTETETTAETSPHEEKEAAGAVPEDVAPVEVITDCDSAVHAFVEVTEKAVDEKEIQTQVQIDLQEVTSVEPTDAQTAKGETEHGALTEETAAESQSMELITEADQKSEIKTEISSEVTKPVMPEEVKTDSDNKQHEILESEQHQQDESVTDRELITEDKTPTEDSGTVAQEMLHVGDELIVLVPRGQAVEMDIEISQSSEKTASDTVAPSEPDSTCDHLIAPETATPCPETLQAPDEETMTEPQQEVKPDIVKDDAPPRNELDNRYSPPAPVQEDNTEEQRMEVDTKDKDVFSPLRSFTPQEDLSELHREDKQSEGAEIEMNKEEDVTETSIVKDDSSPETDLHMTEPQQEVKPDILKDDAPPRNELDNRYSPPAPVQEAGTEEQRMEVGTEDKDVFSPLRSFTPLEDLSELHREDKQSEIEMNKEEDVPETSMIKDDSSPETDLHMTEPQQEVKPDIVKDDAPPSNELDNRYSPPAPVQEDNTEEQRMEVDTEEDKDVFSPLRSFTPQEDLSELHREDKQTEIEMNKEEDVPETSIVKEDSSPETDLHMTEPQQEVKPDIIKDDAPPRNELDNRYSPPAAVQEDNTEEQRMEVDTDGNKDVFSPLRSFTPLQDLSELHREDKQSEAAEIEMNKEEDVPETSIVKEDSIPETDLHREDVEQKMEQDEAVAAAPDVIVEEHEYEILSEEDAKDIPEMQRDAEEPQPESCQEREERMEVEVEVEMETEVAEEEEKVFDLSPEEELIEADYEIIDAEEENQARLAAELQGMNWFCITCGGLLSEDDCVSGEHHNHEVTAVDQAYEEIKEKLSDWISELQGRSENIEDLVSELELAYNSVEDQFVESEAAMQAQNEEMMALVMEQYNDMSVSMEEEKKAKLEQLYDQIVSFQEGIDSAKATLETTAREAETDARSPEDIHASLNAALDSAMSLELGPKGLLVFEDYAKGNTSSSHLTQRKGIPVPQRPTLQPQEPGSATSTSVTVYWKVNPGDIIDCFQVYCMEDPQGAVSEEYRVTVKESYCVLEELEPDKTYKVWVMAVNYTGCSLPSERLSFRTAPSVPVIDTERCTIIWDSATLRWSSANQTPGQSYTLEYCRQYELEGEGLRSISGIRSCEQRVFLQPNENYLFYIKAVNESGASEQSEAALISTKGTRFHLLKASAHPAIELLPDQTTLHYSQDAYDNTPSTDKQCPSILGDLLPAQGRYYWETLVSGSTAYRLGVAYSTANRNIPLGESSLSWCLQCVPSPSGCRYQMLHSSVQSTVFVTEMPERVGTLLDYQHGRLSFYNAQSGHLLGAFCQRFTQPCHPALALDMPGSLEVSMVLETPEFTKDS